MVSLVSNKKLDLKVVAERLERAKSVGDAGVSFEAFALRDMETVLQTGLSFNPEVPEYERYEIIRSGIFRAASAARSLMTGCSQHSPR